MKQQKRYPFSMRKNGHNIELAYNYMRNMLFDNKLDQDGYNKFVALQEVYANAMSCPVYWATGREYGILNEASIWAIEYRNSKRA